MNRILPAWLSPHRAVLLGLLALAVCAFAASAVVPDFGFTPAALGVTLLLSVLVTGVVTCLGAAVVRVPPGADSWLISALILWFVMPVGTDAATVATITLAAAATAASKYLLAWRRRLIINPVVAGALVAYICAYAQVPNILFPIWWVAAEELLIPMILIGVLVVSAIRDWPLVITFLAASLITIGVVELARGGQSVSEWIVSSPMLFLAVFMLPEPLTSPRGRRHRLVYGAGVGVLMYCQVTVAVSDAYTFQFVPEIALAIGCLYAMAARLLPGAAGHRRFPVAVDSVGAMGPRSVALTLRADRPWRFRPGQWALLSDPRWQRPAGARTRRVFSFASPPGRDGADFGFTTAEEISTFKRRVADGETTRLWVDDVAGDFVLPRSDTGGPILLLASGIGITPFRSMLTDALAQSADLRRIRLVHVIRHAGRAVYTDDLDRVREAGATVDILEDPAAANDFGDVDRIRRLLGETPGQCRVFISGNPGFVGSARRAVIRAGQWRPWRIHTDVFLGY